MQPPGCVRRALNVSVEFHEGDLWFDGELQDVLEHDGERVVIHHYRARLIGRGPDLTIVSLTAEPLVLPNAECPGAVAALAQLLGERLSSGFQRRAREVLGSLEGCTHLATLVTTMAATQVPAWYLNRYHELITGEAGMPVDAEAMVDVCQGWQEGGTAVTDVRLGRIVDRTWRAHG